MILKNLERGMRAKFDELPSWKRFFLDRMIGLNKLLTRRRPNVGLSRKLLPGVHRGFGGGIILVVPWGAFMAPSTLQFFYDLGLPGGRRYGVSEGVAMLAR